MNELNENRQQAEVQQLSKAERRRLKGERKRQNKEAEHGKQKRQKIITRSIWTAGIIVAIVGISFLVSNQKTLPPTTMQGHIESSPDSHIVDRPMDIRVHKHMLEHADGSGPPGVIINYNCEDYDCDPGLIGKLTELVNEYPSNVYLAPYSRMSAKLVITRLGKQKILDEFDEEKLKTFIEQR